MTKVASMQENKTAALDAMMEEAQSQDETDYKIKSDIFKMIDQGRGSITDLWAPPRMKIQYDNIEMGDEALAIFTVSNWPESLAYGWLNDLLDDPALADVKMDVSMHIHPVRKEYAMKFMQDKYNAAESSAEAEYERGKVKEANQRIYNRQKDAAQFVRDILENNNENMFQVSLVFGIYGQAQWSENEYGEEVLEKNAHEDLVEKTNKVRNTLKAKSAGGFGIKPLLHQQRDGMKALMPWGSGSLHAFQNFYTSALATCYPFTKGTLQTEDGILYGLSMASGQPIFFNMFGKKNGLNSYNQIIIGNKGSGKSAATKTLLGRYAIMGTQIFIIDPAITGDGEYTNLATSLEGTVIDFGGKNGIYINPMELTPPPDWNGRDKATDADASLIYKAKKRYLEGLIDLLKEEYDESNRITNANLEAFSTTLDILIDRTYQYKRVKINPGDWNYAEWTPEAMPTINDLYKILVEYEKIITSYDSRDKIVGWGRQHLNSKDGTLKAANNDTQRIMFGYYRYVVNSGGDVWGDAQWQTVHYLKNVLSAYTAGSDESLSEKAALFAGTRQADLDNQCIVFRFGRVKSEAMKAIATYLTFELINTRATTFTKSGDFKNKIVVMDEAWKLINSSYARAYLEALWREGRKTNTGIWLISQAFGDFQGDNKVFFNLAESKLIMGIPDNDLNLLMDEMELSPYLADTINATKQQVSPGTAVLHLGGKVMQSISLFVAMTDLELAVADTSDSTKPPLTVAEMIGEERAMALGYSIEPSVPQEEEPDDQF